MKVEEGTTTKKKKKAGEGQGKAASNFRLDLKHSGWWKSGFDNTYLEEQLQRFRE